MCSIMPDYLKDLACEVVEKRTRIDFKLQCLCQGKYFNFYKKILTPEDKEKKEKLEILHKTYKGTSYGDGNGGIWYCTKSFLGIGKKKIRITISQLRDLYSYMRDVILVKCVNCGKEYILFDSKQNGYDGVVDSLNFPEENILSNIRYKQVLKDPAECKVMIRNTVPYDEFMEEFKEEGNYTMYTNAFAEIKIIALREGQQKTIYTAETQ